MDAVLEHKRLNCRELVPTDRLSCVRAFTRLFDSLAVPENGVRRALGGRECLIGKSVCTNQSLA